MPGCPPPQQMPCFVSQSALQHSNGPLQGPPPVGQQVPESPPHTAASVWGPPSPDPEDDPLLEPEDDPDDPDDPDEDPEDDEEEPDEELLPLKHPVHNP